MCQRFPKTRARRGLTLVELLTATAILVVIAGAIAALASTVQIGNRHGQGHAAATQHARVALERIERTLRKATASAEFPGFAVFGDVIGGERFPDTLVVWHPASAAADPAGRPRFSELVVFATDPAQPSVLLEITAPTDTRITPPPADTASWISELALLRTSNSSTRVTLTDLVRTAPPTGDVLESTGRRGVIRFAVEHSPTDAEIAAYRAGTAAWKDLPWVQGIRGAKTGLRQSRCRIELQLMPGKQGQLEDVAGLTAVPFFGSAALYYQVNQ